MSLEFALALTGAATRATPVPIAARMGERVVVTKRQPSALREKRKADGKSAARPALRTKRHSRPLSPGPLGDGTMVFVHQIPTYVTCQELSDAFSGFGRVMDVVLNVPRNQWMSAVVYMADREGAQRCLHARSARVGACNVTIRPYDPPTPR